MELNLKHPNTFSAFFDTKKMKLFWSRKLIFKTKNTIIWNFILYAMFIFEKYLNQSRKAKTINPLNFKC